MTDHKLLTVIIFMMFSQLSIAQYSYEPSLEYPFGKPNPEAPEEIKGYDALIGLCNCKSETKGPDGSWNEPVPMTWRFKYIMNGWGVQDETLKEDGTYSGSIRQYNTDSSKWYVHYYTSANVSPQLSSWEGSRNSDGNIVLYRKQKAPNGMDGFYRLTFYGIDESGYKWIGEWVSPDESVIFPTWKISCTRNIGE
ncbi:MAG: hypothetical protein AAF363_02125 [Bacteroidota bacterium]